MIFFSTSSFFFYSLSHGFLWNVCAQSPTFDSPTKFTKSTQISLSLSLTINNFFFLLSFSFLNENLFHRIVDLFSFCFFINETKKKSNQTHSAHTESLAVRGTRTHELIATSFYNVLNVTRLTNVFSILWNQFCINVCVNQHVALRLCKCKHYSWYTHTNGFYKWNCLSQCMYDSKQLNVYLNDSLTLLKKKLNVCVCRVCVDIFFFLLTSNLVSYFKTFTIYKIRQFLFFYEISLMY